MRLFSPSDGPPWLPRFADSIVGLFKAIMDAPFRLWRVATTDLPAAADYTGGVAWNSTNSRLTYSDGSAWQDTQPYDATLGGLASLPSTAGLLEQTATDVFGIRLIGVANATDVLTRAGGDGRYALVGSGVLSFNTRTGTVTLTSADVTTALTYTPTSVTGLTGVQTVAAFKTGLSLVKADVGLGSVDNTADAAKAVLSATKLTTARNIAITGDLAWNVTFDGSAAVTAAGTLATVNSNVGSFGSATQVGTFTVNAKGLITAASSVTITPAASSVTGAGDLTKADDTNVTLTLGGTPTGALLKAASITAGWTGTLAVTRGGTGLGTATLGDLHYGSAANTLSILTGNTSATRKFLRQTGTGTVSAAPAWDTLLAADVPTLNQNTTGSAAKWTTARNLAGNSTDGSADVAFANKFVVQGTTDAGLSAAQFLGALGTGIVKNTTTTGVLSIAIAADFPTLNQNTAGSAASLTTGRTIAMTGDVAWTSPAFDGTGNVTAAATLATVNANVGSWGSATQVGTFTVNGKGLTTASGNVTITPAVGSITGLGTGVATALAVNVGSAGAFVTFNGALGTPSSGTLTNATGLPIVAGTTGTLTAARGGTGVTTALGSGANVVLGDSGAFTPALKFGGGSTGMTSTVYGRYQRDGVYVICELRVTLTAKGSSTGTATISGLPIASEATAGTGAVANVYCTGMSGIGAPVATIGSSSSSITFSSLGATGGTLMTDANFTNTSEVYVTIWYHV